MPLRIASPNAPTTSLTARAHAPDSARRTVKGCKDTVSGGVYHPTARARDFLANLLLVIVDHVAPSRISHGGSALSRLYHVDKQYCGEHAVCIRGGSDAGQK